MDVFYKKDEEIKKTALDGDAVLAYFLIEVSTGL